ncbi:hypothetical protein TWF788_000569 [Orbilia oligospora]|uniref:Uncharacterized protein n=1 Tax=Orbilia oligospora TaxID=2813651 RepID=A0A6G1MJ59_ORBOL|nr:hypothetical protein TWF788_000569 [Orbilia oligospora]KAF3230392.1 hypothetical protein TWF191_010280 [Orbilia oligospora]KAF3260492.1 hypothetical protein TWF192_009771 [Orbilia oligospora]
MTLNLTKVRPNPWTHGDILGPPVSEEKAAGDPGGRYNSDFGGFPTMRSHLSMFRDSEIEQHDRWCEMKPVECAQPITQQWFAFEGQGQPSPPPTILIAAFSCSAKFRGGTKQRLGKFLSFGNKVRRGGISQSLELESHIERGTWCLAFDSIVSLHWTPLAIVRLGKEHPVLIGMRWLFKNVAVWSPAVTMRPTYIDACLGCTTFTWLKENTVHQVAICDTAPLQARADMPNVGDEATFRDWLIRIPKEIDGRFFSLT